MCGINGIFNFKSLQHVDENRLCFMRDAMILRGPDDAGFYVDKNLGLGHRRLSILDVSSAGHQPFLSKSGRFAMVFNGEIYNFKDFYPEIRAAGYNIETKSDTEILMILFEQHGILPMQPADQFLKTLAKSGVAKPAVAKAPAKTLAKTPAKTPAKAGAKRRAAGKKKPSAKVPPQKRPAPRKSRARGGRSAG